MSGEASGKVSGEVSGEARRMVRFISDNRGRVWCTVCATLHATVSEHESVADACMRHGGAARLHATCAPLAPGLMSSPYTYASEAAHRYAAFEPASLLAQFHVQNGGAWCWGSVWCKACATLHPASHKDESAADACRRLASHVLARAPPLTPNLPPYTFDTLTLDVPPRRRKLVVRTLCGTWSCKTRRPRCAKEEHDEGRATMQTALVPYVPQTRQYAPAFG